MILSQKRVAPDAFHHLAAKQREVLAELRRPLRHDIELLLLQKHFLVHINFNNKFDTEMALTHNLFVNVDEFANMGPSQQGRLKVCFRTPKNQEEGRWMTIAEIFKVLQEQYPMLIADHRTKIRIGQAMKFLNCERKRTNKGPAYYLCSKMAKTC